MPEAFKKAGGIPSPQEKAGGLEATSPRPAQKSAQPVRRKPLRASQKQSNPLLFGCGGAARAGRGRGLLPLFSHNQRKGLEPHRPPNPFFFSHSGSGDFCAVLSFKRRPVRALHPRPQKGLPFAQGPCPGRPRSVPLTGGAPGRHPPRPRPRLFVKRPGRPVPGLSPYRPRRPS